MGKKKNRKSKKQHKDNDDEDERFAAAHNRPQFRVNHTKNANNSSKIVLDERFSSVLTDPRFRMQEKDKYGRKNKKEKKKSKQGGNSELDAFYTVVDEKENEEQSAKEEEEGDNDASTASSSSSSSSSDGSKEKDEDPASRISYLTALSRGELDVSSSSSEDDDDGDSSDGSSDDDSSVEGEDPVHGTAGILDPSYKEEEEEEVEITYEDSPYLAVTNLDWQHVKAMDIFAILSSFAPPGSVRRVQVFVSDFGKEKMAHELKHGPPSLWKKKKKDKKKKQSAGLEEDEDDSVEDSNDDDSRSDNEEEEVEEGMDEEAYAEFLQNVKEQQMPTDSDFDPEKLRAYEASKLKYYFAVAEFDNPASADLAYKEVDGMEFEHSSAAVDLRSIPVEALQGVVENREMRDEATGLPGNYDPPEFIVGALQQTNVSCTWEAGDTQRERMLTKYGSAEQWAYMAENDDLKAYLASDNSSSGDEDDDDSDNDSDAPNAKGAKLRKLLGLDADSDEEDVAGGKEASSDEEEDEGDDKGVSKEIKYVPGKVDLQEKIRTKLQTKNKEEKSEELTPWEKYQQKRKEKRKERRQAARSSKRSDIKAESKPGKQRQSDKFFMEENNSNSDDGDEEDNAPHKPSKAELELLLAGDNDEEVAKDFNMRGLHRIQKNKDKKLSKLRKRKEDKRAAGVSGQEFAIDLKDSRFAKVMDGTDDRFGIDKMDPQYKETPAMREILDEQRVRRKKKRKKNPISNANVAPNVVEGSSVKSAGAAALSSLVRSLKTKVAS